MPKTETNYENVVDYSLVMSGAELAKFRKKATKVSRIPLVKLDGIKVGESFVIQLVRTIPSYDKKIESRLAVGFANGKEIAIPILTSMSDMIDEDGNLKHPAKTHIFTLERMEYHPKWKKEYPIFEIEVVE